MVGSKKLLERFERDQLKKECFSYSEALRIFEALYQEALTLGALPSSHPLEGIDTDIRLAAILNRLPS